MAQPSSINHAYAGRRVLVTGHTGFKGSWLCEWLLAAGADVTGLSLPELPTEPSLFTQLGLNTRMTDLRGDVRDAADVRRAVEKSRPEFVFHLAAQPLVRLSYDQPGLTVETNVNGTVRVLEELRRLEHPCAAVMITTDKCYENREWLHGYREEDALGGYDPYSASKAMVEIAIASWRRCFFKGHPVRIASARAGNVIGGGDWALDRIVPDAIRSLQSGTVIGVRNPAATRPWQHVLEPLSGYLALGAALAAGQLDADAPQASALAFNFGPEVSSNRPVGELVAEMLRHWPGQWHDGSQAGARHEAGRLHLSADKAWHLLGWRPRWDFAETIARTVQWYRRVHEDHTAAAAVTRAQITDFQS
jgi:CDP-glucose 4,6-dehydratase